MRVAKSQVITRLITFLALPLLVVAMPGCASARSFFQMSSDSPVPFFGVDLKLPNKLSRQSESAIADPNDNSGTDSAKSRRAVIVTDADTSGDADAFADSEPFGAEYAVASAAVGQPAGF